MNARTKGEQPWTTIIFRNCSSIDLPMATTKLLAILEGASATGRSLSLVRALTDSGESIVFNAPDVVLIAPTAEAKRQRYNDAASYSRA